MNAKQWRERHNPNTKPLDLAQFCREAIAGLDTAATHYELQTDSRAVIADASNAIELAMAECRRQREQIARLQREYDEACSFAGLQTRHIKVLREALQNSLTLIGNVDHTTGHGPNSARMRGTILHAIRNDLISAALKATE